MSRASRVTLALMWAIWAAQGGIAHAQWSFPGGFGGFCWGGWGFGSAEADVVRGIGLFAEDAGFYEKMTAEARSIDAATVMRWNQFMHESQMNANRVREQRQASTGESKTRLNDERQRRLRDKPEPRDIECGDALNAALDEIDDPRVYARACKQPGSGSAAKPSGRSRSASHRPQSHSVSTNSPRDSSQRHYKCPGSSLIAKHSNWLTSN